MRHTVWMLLTVSLLLFLGARVARGQTGSPPSASSPVTSSANQVQATPEAPTTYTLTPQRRARAIAYSRTLYILYFVGTLIALCIYFLLWRTRVAVKFRQWARRASRFHIVQCLIFVPLFVAVVTLLNLPLEFYSGYVLEHRFGLSTQTAAAWFGDWGKSLLIVAAAGVIVAWVFYSVVGKIQAIR